MNDALKNYLNKNRQQFIDQLSKCCEVPSLSLSKDNAYKVVEVLKQDLLSLGAFVQVYETSGNPILRAEIGTGDKCLMIYGHYDVQPEDPIDKWISNPYSLTLREDKLFARGVCDSKGNTYANIQAIKAWLDLHENLPIKIVFLIEGDEEIGSPNLAKFAADNKHLFAGINWCMFPGEHTARDINDNLIVNIGYKGCYFCELEVTGASKDLHSSLGTIVENSAWRLVQALSTLKDENGNILISGFREKVVPPTTEELDQIDKWPFDEESLKKHYDIEAFVGGLEGQALKRKHIFEPACNICGLNSGFTEIGKAKTVLPHKAYAKLDFRLVPDLTPDWVEQALRAHLDSYGYEDIKILSLVKLENGFSDFRNSIYEKVKSCMKTTYDKEPIFLIRSAGGGPQYYICSQFGIPMFTAGVGYYGSNVHAPNENIRADDYFDHIAFMYQLIGDL